MRKALYALSLLAAAPFAHAADISLGVSNKALAADFTSQPIGHGLEFTVGGLHHSENGNVGTTGLQVSQQINSSFTASLGGKAYFIQNDTRNASAIALGGLVDMAVPTLPQIHFGAHGWYAPSVTSFNNTNSVQDLGAFVSYRVLSNGEVFAAYRHVRVDYEREGGLTIQNGVLFGMKLVF